MQTSDEIAGGTPLRDKRRAELVTTPGSTAPGDEAFSTASRQVSGLKVLSVNPLEHAEELKRLFVANDVPAFPEFFDRVYPSLARAGGRSWIGVDADGRIAAHIARFPRQFDLGGQTVVGGLLVDLLVDKSQRTFLPALTLVRQMAASCKDAADVDFVYGSPNAQASVLFKSAGFSTLGTLDRFVLPLGGRRWYSDLGVQAYRAVLYVQVAGRLARMVEHPAQAFDASAFERPLGEAPFMRPFRHSDLYRQRMADYPSGLDYWFTFRPPGSSSPPSAAILVRGLPDQGAMVVSLSREPSVPLTRIIPPLASALRRHGYRRLWVITMSQTALALDLMHAGFMRRHENRPVIARALTPLGAEALKTAASWEITDLDCDR